MDMRTLAAEYLAACEFGKRLSADTVKAYRIDLRQSSSSPGARRAAVSCCRGISRI